jgi:hypothetical protein
MKDISARVTNITRELRALSIQFQWDAFQNSSPTEQEQILGGLLENGLVEDLRTAVDQLSHFLWCYIESVPMPRKGEGHNLRRKHLAEVTTMLRLLHRSAYPAEDPRAFVERTAARVEQHLETHQRTRPLERSA